MIFEMNEKGHITEFYIKRIQKVLVIEYKIRSTYADKLYVCTVIFLNIDIKYCVNGT